MSACVSTGGLKRASVTDPQGLSHGDPGHKGNGKATRRERSDYIASSA